MKPIPDKVIQAAASFIEQFGNRLEYLGKEKDAKYYVFSFPDDMCLGFPFIYCLQNNEVTEISGFSALDVLGRFVKDA